MPRIKITVTREHRSFATAEVEVDVQHGDTLEDVLGQAELNATDLGAWKVNEFERWPSASEEDKERIRIAAGS